MKTQYFFNLLKNKKIIIYGAGKIGKRIYQSLLSFGFKIEVFWDRNADIISKFDGVSILKPDFGLIPPKLRNEYVVIITIFARNISKEIANNLSKLGYNNVIYDRKTINSIIYQACEKAVSNNNFSFDLTMCFTCPIPKENNNNTCDIFDNYIAKNLAKGVNSFANKKEKLVISKLGLLVSNKCNLCCKGCTHLRDLYKPGDILEFTPDELLGDLERIVEVADLINQVVVVGGEAFLHADLYEILKGVLHLPKIGFIQIITNGSVKPRDPRLFKLMADKRIIVEVSGYGDKIPKILRNNVQNFISELKKHRVNYRYMNTLQWFDFGDFSKRPYNREEHHNVYTSCCFVSNDIFNGKLHKCSRSVFATHLGRIPDYVDDYVDIRKYPKEELRKKLIRFFHNERPSVCLHCNGTSTATVEVASQKYK